MANCIPHRERSHDGSQGTHAEVNFSVLWGWLFAHHRLAYATMLGPLRGFSPAQFRTLTMAPQSLSPGSGFAGPGTSEKDSGPSGWSSPFPDVRVSECKAPPERAWA